MPVDVKNFFSDLKSAVARFPNKAKKIGGSYQINVIGVGSWGIDLAVPSIIDGRLVDPSTTVDISEDDFQRLLVDHGAAMKLYFAGKLMVTGKNQLLALNLPKLLSLGK
jgi:glycerate-2-kinase